MYGSRSRLLLNHFFLLSIVIRRDGPPLSVVYWRSWPKVVDTRGLQFFLDHSELFQIGVFFYAMIENFVRYFGTPASSVLKFSQLSCKRNSSMLQHVGDLLPPWLTLFTIVTSLTPEYRFQTFCFRRYTSRSGRDIISYRRDKRRRRILLLLIVEFFVYLSYLSIVTRSHKVYL